MTSVWMVQAAEPFNSIQAEGKDASVISDLFIFLCYIPWLQCKVCGAQFHPTFQHRCSADSGTSAVSGAGGKEASHRDFSR